jgi:hypothetical protein
VNQVQRDFYLQASTARPIDRERCPRAFGERYVALLGELGRRVAEPGAEVSDLRDDVQELVNDLSEELHGGLDWPLAGTLLANARTVIEVVDDVATARRVRS